MPLDHRGAGAKAPDEAREILNQLAELPPDPTATKIAYQVRDRLDGAESQASDGVRHGR
jgi:hypothetical protein